MHGEMEDQLLKRKKNFLKKLLNEIESGEDVDIEALLTKELDHYIETATEVVSMIKRSFAEKDAFLKRIWEHIQHAKAGDTEKDNTPRKKGWLEMEIERLLVSYINEKQTPEMQDAVLRTMNLFEIRRRVKSYYNIQSVRILASNVDSQYERNWGLEDQFLNKNAEQVKRLEKKYERAVRHLVEDSQETDIFDWLTSQQGIGTMLAGCTMVIIADPQRFRSIGALWAYVGLDVDEEGKAPRRERGELAEWNQWARAKLIGVMGPCILKAAMRYTDPESPDYSPKSIEATYCTLYLNYKKRIEMRNESIPENLRVYTNKGIEIFNSKIMSMSGAFKANPKSSVMIQLKGGTFVGYDKDGNEIGEFAPGKLPRRNGGHIHSMALRYMVKMMLKDALNKWRGFRGLKPLLTWHEWQRGYEHGKHPDGIPTYEERKKAQLEYLDEE